MKSTSGLKIFPLIVILILVSSSLSIPGPTIMPSRVSRQELLTEGITYEENVTSTNITTTIINETIEYTTEINETNNEVNDTMVLRPRYFWVDDFRDYTVGNSLPSESRYWKGFAEDFEIYTTGVSIDGLNGWSITYPYAATGQVESVERDGSNVLKIVDSSNGDLTIAHKPNGGVPASGAITFKFKTANIQANANNIITLQGDDGTFDEKTASTFHITYFFFMAYDAGGTPQLYVRDGASNTATGIYLAEGTFYKVKVNFNDTTEKYYLNIDTTGDDTLDTRYPSSGDLDYHDSFAGDTTDYFCTWTRRTGTAGQTIEIDDIEYSWYDTSASISYKVATKSGSLRGDTVRLHDTLNNGMLIIERPLDKSYANGEARFRFHATTGTDADDYILLELRENGYTVIRCCIDLSAGDVYVYDSTVKTDTTKNVTLDDWNEIFLEWADDDTFQITVNGISVATVYDNFAALTGGVESIATRTSHASDDTDFNIDYIDLYEPNIGFQWKTFVQKDNFDGAGAQFNPGIFESGDNLVFAGTILTPSTKTYPYYAPKSNPSSWTQVTDIEYKSFILFAEANNVLYTGYEYVTGTPESKFAKSTNNGQSWTTIASITDYFCHDLFTIGTKLFAFTIEAIGARDEVRVWEYDAVGDSWGNPGGGGAINLAITTTTLSGAISGGVVDGNDYYIFGEEGANRVATFFKYNNSSPAITKISTPSPNLRLTITNLIKDGTYFYAMLFRFTAPVGNYIIVSNDTGATWTTLEQNTVNILRDSHRNAGDRHWVLYGETNNGVRYYDYNLNHFIKFFDINLDLNNVAVSTSGFLFNVVTSPVFGTEIYVYENNGSEIAECFVEGSGTEQPTQCELVIDPVNRSLLNEGDIIELEDGFNNPIGRFKLQQPEWNPRRGWVFRGVSLGWELFSDHSELYDQQTTKQILQDIIDSDILKFTYRDDSIDTDDDFTLQYTRKVNGPITDFIKKWVREFELAVFYEEPDGLLRCHKNTRLIKTNQRFFVGIEQKGHPQVDGNIVAVPGTAQVHGYRTSDIRLTRSLVIGGHNLGDNDTAEVFKNHVGDPALETTEGRVSIKLEDGQIRNHDECNQMAVNRFTIYNQATLFIHLFVRYQGYLQPGETVHFSWEDVPGHQADIDLDDFLIISWRYDAKNDIYEDFVLTNNIVTEEEYNKVKQAIGRDTGLVSTQSDGTTESTANKTVYKKLTPVNSLIASTVVPMLPEPTGVHFEEGGGSTDFSTLTEDKGGTIAADQAEQWYDLDLSSIVPSGKKYVRIKLLFSDNLIGNYFKCRYYPYTSVYANSYATHDISNKITNRPEIGEFTIPLPPSDSRLIQVACSIAFSAATSIQLTVLNYGP